MFDLTLTVNTYEEMALLRDELADPVADETSDDALERLDKPFAVPVAKFEDVAEANAATAVTGQTVVPTDTISVVTDPILAAQLVMEDAQEVIV
jgi:hypothetical protein